MMDAPERIFTSFTQQPDGVRRLNDEIEYIRADIVAQMIEDACESRQTSARRELLDRAETRMRFPGIGSVNK